MKAFVYHGPKNMTLDQVPDPKILRPTDAIIRVTTSTICGTDKHIRNGGMPEIEAGRIIGHEFCGEVMEIGSNVKHFKKGDKVAVSCVITATHETLEELVSNGLFRDDLYYRLNVVSITIPQNA